MIEPRSVVVIQTAFPGDVVLTLPLLQALRSRYPEAHLAFIAIPSAAGVLQNHPAVDEIVPYDKRGEEKGLRGLLALSRRLRASRFDLAIVPHRSMRSALLPWLARIPARIAFDSSSGRILFTKTVHYRSDQHEIDRNLSLLGPLAGGTPKRELPMLFPSEGDRDCVDKLLRERKGELSRFSTGRMVALAPGSVWRTKRWPEERYGELCAILAERGHGIVLVGGVDDRALCAAIERSSGIDQVMNAAGSFTLLQSAELLRRCRALVCNDSAPMHLAVAMGTPVVAIFGATVPEFGFAHLGEQDRVVQTAGLNCRPCSIHGGHSCPIKTFECMLRITPAQVSETLREILTQGHVNA